MNRRRPEFQTIDVSAWPTVASMELDEAARRDFEMRRQAVMRFAAGESVRDIEQGTGVNRRQLYRWIERYVAASGRKTFRFSCSCALHAHRGVRADKEHLAPEHSACAVLSPSDAHLCASHFIGRRGGPRFEGPVERVRLIETEEERNLCYRQRGLLKIVPGQILSRLFQDMLIAGAFRLDASLQRSLAHGELPGDFSYRDEAAWKPFEQNCADPLCSGRGRIEIGEALAQLGLECCPQRLV